MYIHDAQDMLWLVTMGEIQTIAWK